MSLFHVIAVIPMYSAAFSAVTYSSTVVFPFAGRLMIYSLWYPFWRKRKTLLWHACRLAHVYWLIHCLITNQSASSYLPTRERVLLSFCCLSTFTVSPLFTLSWIAHCGYRVGLRYPRARRIAAPGAFMNAPYICLFGILLGVPVFGCIQLFSVPLRTAR